MTDVADPDEIRTAVREFILSEFLPGEDPASLTNNVPLMSGGILDSISTARLVSFIEGRYGVRFKPHEVGADRFETVDRIVGTVETKLAHGTNETEKPTP